MRRSILFLCAFVSTAVAAQDADPHVSLEKNARRVIAEALVSDSGWDSLSELTDTIGPRLSGSRGAELAVEWAANEFREMGLRPRLEKVMVPKWVRGDEIASLPSHNDQRVVVTALGMSVATPAEGIEAEVIEAESVDEVAALGDRAKGKIVLINHPMSQELVQSGRAFQAYGEVAGGRSRGAVEAAKVGAVAMLVRSLASGSMRNPHTGAMRYDDAVPKIPAAAVTTEDADLLHRLLRRGAPVRLHLKLTPQMEPDVESANVVAEIRGSERPEEIVLVGGHLDSWDLGTGAIDNGSGVTMVLETMRIIQRLNLKPRRTIRAVLFMNEENGLRGARAYLAQHESELANHIAAIETDAGVGEPIGFATTLADANLERLRELVAPLISKTGATSWRSQTRTGADTSVLVARGVAGFGFIPDGRDYFNHHHAPSDTLDKVNPEHLRECSAAVAALTYVLADLDEATQNRLLPAAGR